MSLPHPPPHFNVLLLLPLLPLLPVPLSLTLSSSPAPFHLPTYTPEIKLYYSPQPETSQYAYVYFAFPHYAFRDIIKRGDISPLKSFLSHPLSAGLTQIALFVLLPRRREELNEGLLSAYLLM